MGELHTTEQGPIAMRRAPWLRAFILFVLLCFAGLQTATVVVNHPHEHTGPHSHCCPICHASHVPAMQAVAGIAVSAPGAVQWHTGAQDVRVASANPIALHSSRAPPQSASYLALSVFA
jgi:hypothetical protein